jgi:alkanesulfonate monooxygenase SsuD/methylene tetrahydromethanopterin reductase-like flavin-dependent oxidoreductase (luciferase family)
MRVGTIVGFQNPPQWRTGWPELYASTLDFVGEAERLGFDLVWLTEHHFADDGYCPALMPVAAAIAARTTRLRIGTKVMLMPFHHPVRLAEDIAVVDVISGGRLEIGLAAGYRTAEFTGFGIPHDERAARAREGLAVLEQALTGETFSHSGRFHALGPARITPPPVQQPVPIWWGARSAGAIRHAAKRGHHLALADFDEDLCATDYETYRDALVEYGRRPDEYRVVSVTSVFVDEDPQRAAALAAPHIRYQQLQYQRWFAQAGDRAIPPGPAETSPADLPSGCLVGTPEQVRDEILAVHRRVPFTDFSFWTLLPGMKPSTALGSLELFAERVLPALRSEGHCT